MGLTMSDALFYIMYIEVSIILGYVVGKLMILWGNHFDGS